LLLTIGRRICGSAWRDAGGLSATWKEHGIISEDKIKKISSAGGFVTEGYITRGQGFICKGQLGVEIQRTQKGEMGVKRQKGRQDEGCGEGQGDSSA